MGKYAKMLLAAGVILSAALLVKFYAGGRASFAEDEPIREMTSKEEDLPLEETAIHYQTVYNMKVTSAQMALDAIKEEGQRQRENYHNPPVEDIERKMEEEFGISAVNLGEISEKTALDIYDAFCYMYEKYPQLYGSLTNLTLEKWAIVQEVRWHRRTEWPLL